MKKYKVITENNESQIFDNEDKVLEFIKKELEQGEVKTISPIIEIIETGYESIKTFEDACQHLGLDPEETIGDCHYGSFGRYEEARRKLEIITKAINEGWEPDILDFRQNKWYPWLKVVKKDEPNPNPPETPHAGLAYVGALRAPSYSAAAFGSRLCFRDEKRARHAVQYFMDLYEIMLLG